MTKRHHPICPRCGNTMKSSTCGSSTCSRERRLQEDSIKIQKQQAEDLKRFQQESLRAQREQNRISSTPSKSISQTQFSQDQFASDTSFDESPIISDGKIRSIFRIIGAMAGMFILGCVSWTLFPYMWGRLVLMTSSGLLVGALAGHAIGAILERLMPWIIRGAIALVIIIVAKYLWGTGGAPKANNSETHGSPAKSNSEFISPSTKNEQPLGSHRTKEQLFIELDNNLNTTYREVMQRLNSSSKEKLKIEQRAWLKNLEKSAEQDPGNSLEIKIRMTAVRITELQNTP